MAGWGVEGGGSDVEMDVDSSDDEQPEVEVEQPEAGGIGRGGEGRF